MAARVCEMCGRTEEQAPLPWTFNPVTGGFVCSYDDCLTLMQDQALVPLPQDRDSRSV